MHPTPEQQKQNNIRFLQLVTGFLLLFYFPFLLTHPYFADDWHRATEEFANFRAFGRVFGSYFLHFLTSDYQNLTETTPLFKLASIAIIIGSVCFTLKIRKIPFTTVSAVAVIAFLFNPFFISCLLYRYDCLTMTIAMMSALLAWAFFSKRPIVSVLFLILSLGTYQPFINLFILLGVAEFTYRIINGQSIKESIYTLLRLCAVYFIAFAIYRLAIIPAYSVKTGRSTFIPFDSIGLSIVITKIKVTLNIYSDFLSLTGKIIYGTGVLLALCGLISTCKKKANNKRLLRILIALFALIIVFPLSYGPFLLLSDTAINGRILAPMIVFSVIIAALATDFLLNHRPKWLAYVFIVLFLLCPLSFSYMASNARTNQDDFEDFITKDVASQIFLHFPENKTVFVDGKLPFAPLVRGGAKRYPGLAGLAISSDPWISQLKLKTLGIKNVLFEWQPNESDIFRKTLCQSAAVPTIQSRYYALYPVKDQLFIWMGEEAICPKLNP